MPFVIPRISVPADYNTTTASRRWEYGPEPTVDQLEKYEAWLCEELSLTKEAINSMRYGVSVTEVETPEPKEKQ